MSLNLSSSFLDFNFVMSGSTKSGIFEFDRFRIDGGKLMLYSDGAELSVRPKVVETLLVLVQNRGQILSKDELIGQVWSDAVVEESNLSQHLYQLRKILGNRPDGQPYIETLRRRGYRFNGEVRSAEPAEMGMPANGAASQQPIRASAARADSSIERHGNVLRLVDWASVAVTEPATGPPSITLEPEKPASSNVRTFFLAAMSVIILLGVSVAVILIYRSRTTEPPQTFPGEMSIVKITNGIKPEDAAISPNGDYFVYHEIDGETSRMWLQQVGQATRVEIGAVTRETYIGKTFSPDGRYVYYVTTDKNSEVSTLFRVPSIGGPSSKVHDDVDGPISFAPDGKEFVFVRHDKKGNRSSIVTANIENPTEEVIFTGLYSHTGLPAWSPDGKAIVAGIYENSDQNMLAKISRDGGEPQKISDEKWDNIYRIAWAPDGSGFAMIGTRDGDGYTTRRDQVYFVSYPTGRSRRLTTDGNRHKITSLGFANDGSVLAVPFSRSSQIWSVSSGGQTADAIQLTYGSADGRAGLAPLPDGRVGFLTRNGDAINIWTVGPDVSSPTQVTQEPEVVDELRSDPNGRFFVYSTMEGKYRHLYRVEADGGNARQLTTGLTYDTDSSVSPDGKWLVYDSQTAEEDPSEPFLWKLPLDGGEPAKLSDMQCRTPTFSPDGAMIACIVNAGQQVNKQIAVLSAETGSLIERYKLPAYSTVNFGAGWTPDGSGLVYIMLEKGNSNLWVIPRNGGAPRRLTNFTGGEIYRYAYSHDGSRLYVARGYPEQDAILIKNFQ